MADLPNHNKKSVSILFCHNFGCLFCADDDCCANTSLKWKCELQLFVFYTKILVHVLVYAKEFLVLWTNRLQFPNSWRFHSFITLLSTFHQVVPLNILFTSCPVAAILVHTNHVNWVFVFKFPLISERYREQILIRDLVIW